MLLFCTADGDRLRKLVDFFSRMLDVVIACCSHLQRMILSKASSVAAPTKKRSKAWKLSPRKKEAKVQKNASLQFPGENKRKIGRVHACEGVFLRRRRLFRSTTRACHCELLGFHLPGAPRSAVCHNSEIKKSFVSRESQPFFSFSTTIRPCEDLHASVMLSVSTFGTMRFHFSTHAAFWRVHVRRITPFRAFLSSRPGSALVSVCIR